MPASDGTRDARCIADILRQGSKQLQSALNLDSSTARIEVQCLLQHVLNVNRAYLLTYPERVLSDDESARYTGLFERRLKGEPIAYLLEMREFFGMDFKVTPATLIPRPDTELLVEIALQHLSDAGAVLDMGTGSGAIALSIADQRPDVSVVAVDASTAALDIARENAQRFNLANVKLLQSDWFSQLAGQRFDLIVSNPPYIEENDIHLSQGDVRFEPMTALASGKDGLDDIRRIVSGAKDHLNPGGWLMFEHGYNQAARVRELLEQAGYTQIASFRDMSGIERVTIARA